jgi:hypothetical protein
VNKYYQIVYRPYLHCRFVIDLDIESLLGTFDDREVKQAIGLEDKRQVPVEGVPSRKPGHVHTKFALQYVTYSGRNRRASTLMVNVIAAMERAPHATMSTHASSIIDSLDLA